MEILNAVNAALDLVMVGGMSITEAADHVIKTGLATPDQRGEIIHVVGVEMGR